MCTPEGKILETDAGSQNRINTIKEMKIDVSSSKIGSNPIRIPWTSETKF